MSASEVLAHLDTGAGALARGDRARARKCLLSAARGLLLLARESQGPARSVRAEQAQRLIARSRDLKVIRSPGNTAPNPRNASDPGDAREFHPVESPDLGLDDVAGAEEVKKLFKAKFLYPLTHPERAAAYRQSGAGGVLLFGLPGTGKTFLARALAGELKAPVFTIKPSDIMSKWVGDSEQNVARLFADARRHPVALIFVDEIDALASSRDPGSSGVSDRVLAQLLAELDGFQKHAGRLLFVGASNEPWNIDPALLRTGRFDALCHVGLPDRAARKRILADFLNGVPVDATVDADLVAERTDGCSGAEVFAIANHAAQAAYFDVIENGHERPVSGKDFEYAIGKVHRAATPELLQRFRDFEDGQ